MMQNFLDKLRSNAQKLMEGRYGSDQLCMALVVVALVLSVIALWAGRWLNIVALLILAVAILRIFSRNHAARRAENRTFLRVFAKPRQMWRRQYTKWVNRKTKAYVRCPHCGAEFALPKGKGRLRATCPRCGEKSDHTV